MAEPLAPPPAVVDLVHRFNAQREDYRAGRYNETQLRREFLDPLFKTLGWDIDNEAGYAEAYKDVIHEDAIKVGGATKAPDYAFRIGGQRKFFVEAKKPSVDIKHDLHPAYQLRRYAWSAKLPLSILTDFEELAVYDCRTRPKPTDKASTARILYLTCDDYLDPARWASLHDTFSKEAILTGAFDRYARKKTRKRGTAEVDDEFLAELERWRMELARHLARRNDLTARRLNHAVQLIIDRIVFLRICEDRGLERAGSLQSLLNGDNLYPRLLEKFQAADARYNSGLFHFDAEAGRPNPDTLTPHLDVGDRPIKDILAHLYPPKSPYEFSVLPADILGQAYERFLGSVIQLSPTGKTATVEAKPEVRKAGGVYYTPTYIVDYIVRHTIGKLLEDRSIRFTKTTPPRLDKPLRVLDPACGSGSFLLGAYQFLLDWHLDQYVRDDPRKWAKKTRPPIAARPRRDTAPGMTGADPAAGDWKLTAPERRRILTEHIYGVDLDAQAVEVTKLSLLLKVLEGETPESLTAQHRLYGQQTQRALPDLSRNIQCGNALIGTDFYDHQQTTFDFEDQLRINAFDWEDGFPEIMKAGGFDAVIGNPPYIRMEAFKELKDYLRDQYHVHAERADIYAYFIEKEHELLRRGGRFGMIVSNKFLRAKYGQNTRQLLAETAAVRQIIDFSGLPVFHGATVRTIILITEPGTEDQPALYNPPPDVERFKQLETSGIGVGDLVDGAAYEVPQSALTGRGWALNRPDHAALMRTLEKRGTPFMEAMSGRICMGIKSGLTKAFVISGATREAIVRENPEADEILKPFLQGRDIRQYHLKPSGDYLIYTHHGIDMKRYPAVLEHLRPFKQRLRHRATKQEWYELQQPQLAYAGFLKRPKIVFPDMATRCRFTFDRNGHFGANTMYFLPTDDLRLLALLNSRLAQFYFIQTCAALEGPGDKYLRFFGQYLEHFPVPGESEHDRELADLSNRMLDLHEDLTEGVYTPQELAILDRRITATDRRIDQLVYTLYGLSEEDIATVEAATV